MARSFRQWGNPFWHIVQFYWKHSNAGQKRAMAIGVLLLTVLSVLAGTALVFESIQRGEFISALAARDPLRSQAALTKFIGILLFSAAVLSVSAYVRDRLGLRWRKGLSRQVLSAYLTNQHYYRLPESIDNPDQRISEDIRNISQLSVVVFAIFLESGVQLIGFVGVLLSISVGLTGFLLVYALVGSAIATLVFGRRLTRINAEQLKREANFRANLIDVRENAESIAFYHTQIADISPERKTSGKRFGQVVKNFNRFIRWQLGLDCFQNGYQYLTFILPSLILAPSILTGDLEVGAIVQSQAAFDRIWLSLSLVIVQFEQLTALAASTSRLQTLLTAIESKLQKNAAGSNIQLIEQPALAVENLTVNLPIQKELRKRELGQKEPASTELSQAGQSKATLAKENLPKALFQDLSFTVSEPLLITGPSGIGKSSLVKAIAGLWHSGQGTITCPQDDILFLPQQPYMTLGTLRQQLLYPNEQSLEETSDKALLRLLKQVQLPELSDLDKIEDWANQLSTGEQQRLAFARLLVKNPTYAILDESTSALSIEQEKDLYQQLATTAITFVSIGHRPSLLPYHSQVLTLSGAETWTLEKTNKKQPPTVA